MQKKWDNFLNKIFDRKSKGWILQHEWIHFMEYLSRFNDNTQRIEPLEPQFWDWYIEYKIRGNNGEENS